MSDGDRELLADLNAEAAADQRAWGCECPACGLVFWTFEDVDAHLTYDCEGDESVIDLLTGAAA